MSSKKEPPLKLYTEADSPTGVDDYLLLAQLRKTPRERLEWAEEMQKEIFELRSRARRLDEDTARTRPSEQSGTGSNASSDR